MKKIYLIFVLIIFFFTSNAQNASCEFPSDYPVFILDSFSFENTNTGNGKILIDTTFPDNIWQIGTVQKSGFPNAFSGQKAIQTDTLNSYPINNESAFIVYLDSTFGWYNNYFSFTFWHYYNTDSLNDSCILQITIDSGKTWSNIFTLNAGQPFFYYNCSLNNYSGGFSLFPQDTLLWSGNSNGWHKESICSMFIAIKGVQIPTIQGFRFLFHSDSIQTNKPGWMIDDIVLKSPQFVGGINQNNSAKKSLLYPNPSNNGIFNIDYPHNYVTGKIELYNIYGQKMKELKLAPTINITDLPKGLYHYNILFYKTQQKFSGTIEYD